LSVYDNIPFVPDTVPLSEAASPPPAAGVYTYDAYQIYFWGAILVICFLITLPVIRGRFKSILSILNRLRRSSPINGLLHNSVSRAVILGFFIALGFSLFSIGSKEANEIVCRISTFGHRYCARYGHYSIFGERSFLSR
jgi:hypothetical protein